MAEGLPKYNSAMVEQMLQNASAYPPDSSWWRRKVIDIGTDMPITKVDLPSSQRLAPVKICFQGRDATCTPRSLVSSTLAIEVKPEADFVAELLNLSSLPYTSSPTGQRGVDIHEVPGVFENYTDSEMNLVQDEADWYLPQRNDCLDRPAGILRNAELIKTRIDEGYALVISVNRRAYSRAGHERGYHSLALVGYQISNSGMLLQVFDSVSGEELPSLDRITESMNEVPLLVRRAGY